MNYRILLVDDEPDILEFVSYNLLREGFQVQTAPNGVEALKIAEQFVPHLVLLDVMMPEMDGMETCRRMRQMASLKNTMIVFLSARGEDESQLEGFELGADDYITKPVKVKLLVSRLKAILKRTESENVTPAEEPATEAAQDVITIDKERFVVVKNGKEITLPRKEFQLLDLLYSKPQKVFSREEIYSTVWGSSVIVGDRTIDVHIRKLRTKIGEDHIVTIKGVGYKFQ
ncbi:MAG: response regulator transcription factor [Tidjanibacter sp.]|nr:response regulator transcription factor [Tidjanibacter sp.]MBR3854224.1 response regulator transcription factor [Tidjanibacter sp.]